MGHELKLMAIEDTLYRRIVDHLIQRYALRLSVTSMNLIHEWISTAVGAASASRSRSLDNREPGDVSEVLSSATVEENEPTSPGFRRPLLGPPK